MSATEAAAKPFLDEIHVAKPCPADWNAMKGDDRVRFCGQCSLNVYNLSAMSRPEAEALVASREGRLCVRFFRRTDGTVLTEDCPVGLAALRRRMKRWAAAVAAALLISTGIFAASRSGDGERGGLRALLERWFPSASPPPGALPAIAGDICAPPYVGPPNVPSPAGGGGAGGETGDETDDRSGEGVETGEIEEANRPPDGEEGYITGRRAPAPSETTPESR